MKKFPRDNTTITGLEPISSETLKEDKEGKEGKEDEVVEEIPKESAPPSQVLKKASNENKVVTSVSKPKNSKRTKEEKRDCDTFRLSQKVLLALSEASEASDFCYEGEFEPELDEKVPPQHPLSKVKLEVPDAFETYLEPRKNSFDKIKIPEDVVYYLDTHPRWEFIEKSDESLLWSNIPKNEFLIVSRKSEGKVSSPETLLKRIAHIEGRGLGSVFIDLILLVKIGAK